MKHTTKAALAASAFVCAAMFSFGWSEQGGVSLSVDKAQAARVVTHPVLGRPVVSRRAGVARRNYRRGAYGREYGYGYGPGPVGTAAAAGAGLAAGAAGTAAAIATSPFGGPYRGGPYYGNPYQAQAYYGAAQTDDNPFYVPRAYYAGGPWLGYSGWDDYKARNGISCDPGTVTKMGDGEQYICQ